jgi:hypothetical protein
MIWGLLVLSVFGMRSPMSGQVQSRQPYNVGRICGKLVHTEQVPVKNTNNTFEYKRQTLSRITVRVFRAKENEDCCDFQSMIGEAQTGRWGGFRFKKLDFGLFWLVAHVEGRDYKILLQNDRKRETSDECSDTDYSIEDSGALSVGRTVTVN